MTVTTLYNTETKTAELTVNGRVTSADFDAVAPEFEAFVSQCGTIRMIEIIESLDGFDPSTIWKGIKLDLKVLPHISHCAVVGDIGWLSPLSRAAGSLMSTKLRTFPMDELQAARDWIETADPETASA